MRRSFGERLARRLRIFPATADPFTTASASPRGIIRTGEAVTRPHRRGGLSQGVDAGGRRPALGDGGHDQVGAAHAVARREDARRRRSCRRRRPSGARLDAPRRAAVDRVGLDAGEPDRHQHEVGGERGLLAGRAGLGPRADSVEAGIGDPAALHRPHARRHRPRAPSARAATRACRPRSCAAWVRSRNGHSGQVASGVRARRRRRAVGDLGHRRAPSRSAQPRQSALVSPPPRTTTSLARRRGSAAAGRRPATRRLRAEQVGHRQLDAAQTARRADRAARCRCAPVASSTASKRARSSSRRERRADGRRRTSKPHALGLELVEPAVDQPLLELEVGDAEAQQPAGARRRARTPSPRARPGPAAARRRGRRGRCRRSPTDRPVAATAGRGRTQPSANARSTIAISTCLIVTGVVVQGEHARLLARRGAELAGELGEVVRLVQPRGRLAPAAGADELVPVGYEVAQRAAGVAERHAAAHAPGGLLAHQGRPRRAGPGRGDRGSARATGPVRRRPAREGDEAARVSHRPAPASAAGRLGGRPRAAAAGRRGITLTNACERRPARHRAAARRRRSPCAARWRSSRSRTSGSSASPGGSRRDRSHVAARGELAVGIEHERHAAGHARRRSCARSAPSTQTTPPVMYSQPWSPTPSTTAAAPGVAHAEPLARAAAQERLARGRAVEHGVAGDDVRLGDVARARGRPDDQAPAREALARVVVARTLQVDGEPAGRERRQALPGTAGEAQDDRVVGQAGGPGPARDLAGEHRPDAAIGVPDRPLEHDRARPGERSGSAREEVPVECRVEAMIGRTAPARRRHATRRHRRDERAQIEAREPRPRIVAAPEQIAPADDVLEPRDAEVGQELAHVLGDEQEIAHDVLGRAGEPPPQLRDPGWRSRRGTC